VTSGRAVKVIAYATTAAAGLAVAVVAGSQAHAALVRTPTPAELSAAAATGVAQRWERESAGDIFPSSIGYTSDLQTSESASRVAIAPGDTCAAAVDATLATQAQLDGCVAGLRADYTDQLRGAVYTLGVLAFGSTARAADFYNKIPLSSYPATGLHAFAVPGTAAARFDDAARQASAAQLAGPYVVLAVAGYADGRPASAADERRDSVFDPATELVSTIAEPLGKPVTVHCGTTEWACSDPSPDIPAPPPELSEIRPDEMQTLDQIDVPAAWQTSKGSGVTVAVLDTGVDASAPDLAGDVTTGPDYTAGADPPGYQPPLEHGTYIASLIAAHGSGPGDAYGVIGVAPEAKILSVRVILDDGEPGLQAYNEDSRFGDAIGKGIYYAVKHGATVINMSLGSEQATAYLRAAVAYAVSRGVVVVASAGNSGTSSGFAPYLYPASFTGVIAVAAVDSKGARAFFSEQNASVVLSAPGVDVIGAGPDGEYIDAEGTSPSAALVSGVAALIKSRYPGLSPALVEQALIASATGKPRGGYSPQTGFGQVNAAAALQAAARLAASAPAAGLASASFFGAANEPGQQARAGQAAIAPIQVVHRDTTLIAGYAAASGAGVVCAIVMLVLLGGLARKSRRDDRQQPGSQQWQQPFAPYGQPGQVPQGPQAPPLPQRPPMPQAPTPPPPAPPPWDYQQPPWNYQPPPPANNPPPRNYRDYPNRWFDPQ
jgi:type VII secretion-associated serine protease mycosin